MNPGEQHPGERAGPHRQPGADALTPIVLTYYNLGNAKVSGVDLGTDRVLTSHVEAARHAVHGEDRRAHGADGREPGGDVAQRAEHEVDASAPRRANIGPVTAGLTFRNVNGYYFRSGTNTGVIPTFGTLDANVSVKVPRCRTRSST